MKSKSSIKSIKGIFEHPILFNTFRCDETRSDVFDHKDIIQFTSELGVFVIRHENDSLYFCSTENDNNSFIYDEFPADSLIAAPSQTKTPFCFAVFDNIVYKFDNLGHKTEIYHPFFKIVSIYANNKFLFVGTNTNCLARIDYSESMHRFILFNFSKESVLAITSYKNLVCIVSSRYYLIVIDQFTLRKLFRIPLTFTVLDDVQIKVGEINGFYSAAILSDSKIHLISFKPHPFYYFYQSWIPGNSVISYDFHNNSVVVVQESTCNFNDFSGNFSRISVYPRFLNDPQYEWDITKELEFICQIDVKPSERRKLIKDKLNHISSVFGHVSDSESIIDYSKIIQALSPRHILPDSDGNLWITVQNSLLYCIPMDEEMAIFRGMLNFGYDYAAECSEESSNDDIINFIQDHMISLSELQDIFKDITPIGDISTFVNTYADKNEIIARLNQYLAQRAKAGEKPPEIGTIAQNVYEKMSSYMHSDIDFVVNHDQDKTKDFLHKIADDFFSENEEDSIEIAKMFDRNLKNINKYINNHEDLRNQQDQNILQSWKADVDKFWTSVLVEESYQSMKFYISLLIASYLHKKLILAQKWQIHYQFCKLTSRIEETVYSLASIYQISLNSHINLQLEPYEFNFNHFLNPKYRQLSTLLNSTDFMFKFICDSFGKINLVLYKIDELDHEEVIDLKSDAEKVITAHSLEDKLKALSTIKEKITENEDLSVPKIMEIKRLITEIERINLTDRLSEILNFSSNVKNPDHLLIISLIHLENHNIDLFFKYFRRFKFYGKKAPEQFYKFVIDQIKDNDPQTLVTFVNDEYNELIFSVDNNLNREGCSSLKVTFFEPYFLGAIKIKDFESAFNALMGLFSAKPISSLHIKSLEYLIKSMKENNCIGQFSNFPLGINRTKILNIMSSGSPSLIFLASAIYNKCGEYSKSGSVLLKYINSILFKNDATESELRKAKSAAILISSLMDNHRTYIRNSITMCLLDRSYLNTILGKIETRILEKHSATISNQTKQDKLLNANSTTFDIPDLNSHSNYDPKYSKKYTPKEAAYLLNKTDIGKSSSIQSYTEHFRLKPNCNQQIYKFIENLNDEESLQFFLANAFSQKLNNNQFYGLWFNIIYAQHNLQSMNAYIQAYILSKRRISEYDPKKQKQDQYQQPRRGLARRKNNNLSQKVISKSVIQWYDLCASMISEIISSKKTVEGDIEIVKPIFNFPFSAEITRKLFPLLQICYFKTLKCEITQNLISTNYIYDDFIDKSRDQGQSLIVACPRGKLTFSETSQNGQTITLDKSDEFIIVKKINSDLKGTSFQIEGDDDNTLVVLAKTVL